ncbi:uncharacterized protein LOC132300260 [Cornus florida]|uniref:uncharacterized protein LOC132300260 n=1 Tax=Cornus florida TaxID=4283 RepID=UPI00289A2A5A|nr:uncharacterized protein LOC132300260 [Cornus florida]
MPISSPFLHFGCPLQLDWLSFLSHPSPISSFYLTRHHTQSMFVLNQLAFVPSANRAHRVGKHILLYTAPSGATHHFSVSAGLIFTSSSGSTVSVRLALPVRQF